MIYLNQAVRNTRWSVSVRSNLKELLMPETYLATTVKDFLDNRDKIRPTKKFWPFGVLWYNRAIVELATPVVYTNVSPDVGNIADLNSSVDVDLDSVFLVSSERNALKNNMRLYWTWLIYNPRNDDVFLSGFETERDSDDGGRRRERESLKRALDSSFCASS